MLTGHIEVLTGTGAYGPSFLYPQASFTRTATGKKRKTTLVQYETLSALRSTMVAKIVGRIKSSPSLVKEIEDQIKTCKEEAQTDVEEWSKNTSKGLAEARTKILAGDFKTKGKKDKKNKTKKDSKKKEKKRKSSDQSSDSSDEDAGLEALEFQNKEDEEESDSETLELSPYPKKKKKRKDQEKENKSEVKSADRKSEKSAPSEKRDDDLFQGKFTPQSGTSRDDALKPSDSLVEMLTQGLEENFKVQKL